MKNCASMNGFRSMLWLLVAALLLVPCIAAAQDNMTLEEAVIIGLQNNFDIQIARNSAEAALNDIGRGTAGFLPTLDSLGNYGYDTTHVSWGHRSVGR